MNIPIHNIISQAALAQIAVEAFVAVLEAEHQPGLVGQYRVIATALRCGHPRRAMEIYEGIRVAGADGLAIIYAANQPVFDRAREEVDRALKALRAATPARA